MICKPHHRASLMRQGPIGPSRSPAGSRVGRRRPRVGPGSPTPSSCSAACPVTSVSHSRTCCSDRQPSHGQVGPCLGAVPAAGCAFTLRACGSLPPPPLHLSSSRPPRQSAAVMWSNAHSRRARPCLVAGQVAATRTMVPIAGCLCAGSFRPLGSRSFHELPRLIDHVLVLMCGPECTGRGFNILSDGPWTV